MKQFVIRAARVVRRRMVRAIRRRSHRHGLILTYHRIAAGDGPDPWRLMVSPNHFREHLQVLIRVADVVPLCRLRERMSKGRGRRPVAALTFDDGYSDNLHEALPVLEHFGLSSTLFVATSWIGRAEPFWWDTLTTTILGSHPLPSELALSAGRFEIRWHARGSRTRGQGIATADRIALHAELRERLRLMNDETRAAVCKALESWSGRSRSEPSDARPLTADELHRMHASGLVEIGAHTMTHCSLPAWSPSEQAAEIVGSREACERLLGCAPTSFAYPYGDHNGVTARLVGEAGFARACTNEQELAWADADPLRMARFVVLDWNGDDFERRLRREWLP